MGLQQADMTSVESHDDNPLVSHHTDAMADVLGVSVFSSLDPFVAVNGLVTGLPCWSDHGFQYFDPSTEFLSYCLTTLLNAVLSLVLVGPLIVRVVELRQQERDEFTMIGQYSLIGAIFVVMGRLTGIFLQQSVPNELEWVIFGVGIFAVLLHYVQDGRVRVCSASLLIYWLLQSFFAISAAVDELLRHAQYKWLSVSIAVVSCGILYFETHNGRGKGMIGFETATIFEKITFSFADKLLEKGSKEHISHEDLPVTPRDLNAVNCYDQLITVLEQFDSSNKYRVISSLLFLLRTKLTGLLLMDVSAEIVQYISPSVLSLFLNSLQNYQAGISPLFPCFYFAVLVGVLPMIVVSLQNITNIMANYTYVISRTGLTSLIYRKSLRLSPAARENWDSSRIMNLINVDTDQIDGVASVLPNLVSAPVALVLSTWQLYRFIGKSMFAAIAFYVVFVPFTAYVSRTLGEMYPEIMKIKDERNKVTSNAFRNIKSLKLYAWEKPFHERIATIRSDKEMKQQRAIQILYSLMSASWTVLGDLVAAAIFITYLWLHMGALSPGVVFPALLLLQYVTFPFMSLPMTITSILRALTSQTRIHELLKENDQDYANFYRYPASEGFEEPSLMVEDSTISWNGDTVDEKIALQNLSFDATKGDLVCITGRVGAGKTALLKALAGELRILDGSISVKGSIAYCSQEAWLQNTSVRNNILFGKNYDEEFYRKTLEACDLVSDLSQLPDNDQTDVGERGISLSGGQKARVSLARAVYSKSDIYLLDDVLSAVDEHVAKHLIERLFSHNGLLADRTIILATNNVKVLSHASLIIALEGKKIVEKKSVAEVLKYKEGSKIYRLIKEFGGGDLVEADDRKAAISRTASSASVAREPPRDSSAANLRAGAISGQDDEERESNAVSLWIFARYFDSAGTWYLVVALGIMAISVVITNSTNIWIGIMSGHNFDNLADAKWYLVVYILIALASSLSIFMSSAWFVVLVAIEVSKVLHNTMLWNLMHAKMSFFDLTPLGRIVNRFTGDISSLDQQLPNMLYFFVRSILNAVMGILTVLTGSPIVIFVVIPLMFLGDKFRRDYVPSSRQVSRMTSAANSPILSHIEETLKGQTVVRAFDRGSQFVEIYDARVDYWIELAFVKINMQRWLGFRIQAMTSILLLASGLSMTTLVYQGKLGVGYVGVVLHFAMRVGIMVNQIISMWANLEVSGVALERILEYVDIEQEAPPHIDETAPSDDWPTTGAIAFDSMSARYKPEGPDVLKNLSLAIEGREKIGIVGRTGSGKSTLTLTVFRLLEPHAGHILIDGTNTSELGLNDLRSRLSIIPQDAQIFDGTLRENLDPLGENDDARLWQVLELCHLKEHFSGLRGLDTELADSGDNLSRGQAQLVCLGRALIHEARILVLDEATASVDVETDSILQRTIRSEFKDRTILTIAHRINTIMDSDRIIVLDKGEIKEFDTPERLLASEGIFWSLVNTGEKDL